MCRLMYILLERGVPENGDVGARRGPFEHRIPLCRHPMSNDTKFGRAIAALCLYSKLTISFAPIKLRALKRIKTMQLSFHMRSTLPTTSIPLARQINVRRFGIHNDGADMPSTSVVDGDPVMSNELEVRVGARPPSPQLPSLA